VENKGVEKGSWVHRKNRNKNDRYHDNQDKERNPMGEVLEESVGEGGRVHRKNRPKRDRYHCNQDIGRNPMVEVPNKGVDGTTSFLFLFFHLLLSSIFRMPKLL
jgi:hypothetical protein